MTRVAKNEKFATKTLSHKEHSKVIFEIVNTLCALENLSHSG